MAVAESAEVVGHRSSLLLVGSQCSLYMNERDNYGVYHDHTALCSDHPPRDHSASDLTEWPLFCGMLKSVAGTSRVEPGLSACGRGLQLSWQYRGIVVHLLLE